MEKIYNIFKKISNKEKLALSEIKIINKDYTDKIKNAQETMIAKNYFQYEKELKALHRKNSGKHEIALKKVSKDRNDAIKELKEYGLVGAKLMYETAAKYLTEKLGKKVKIYTSRFKDTQFYSGHVGDYRDYDAKKYIISINDKNIFMSDTFELNNDEKDNKEYFIEHIYAKNAPRESQQLKIYIPLQKQLEIFNFENTILGNYYNKYNEKNIAREITAKYNERKKSFEKTTGISFEDFNNHMLNELSKQKNKQTNLEKII